MILDISYTCFFLDITKDVWDAVQQTYSKARNATQLYKVKAKTIVARCGDNYVIEYASHTKYLWQEFDHSWIIKTKCVGRFGVYCAGLIL